MTKTKSSTDKNNVTKNIIKGIDMELFGILKDDARFDKFSDKNTLIIVVEMIMVEKISYNTYT